MSRFYVFDVLKI